MFVIQIRTLLCYLESSQNGTSGSSLWTDYLGDEAGEKTSIIIRFPDGKKEKKDIPCSSKFMVRNVTENGYTVGIRKPDIRKPETFKNRTFIILSSFRMVSLSIRKPDLNVRFLNVKTFENQTLP